MLSHGTPEHLTHYQTKTRDALRYALHLSLDPMSGIPIEDVASLIQSEYGTERVGRLVGLLVPKQEEPEPPPHEARPTEAIREGHPT
jgi:hypothetical protein